MVTMGAFVLGLAVMPLARSAAFVPSMGPSRFCSGPGVGARGFTPSGVSPAFAKAGEAISMTTDKAAWEGGQEAGKNAGSRAHFLGRISAGVAAVVASGAVVGGSGLAVAPAFADSTGKYSSKATAKKRYVPRIVKFVGAFQLLKKQIADESASPKSEFFVEKLPDALSAMVLYSSSMKRGETPDSTSKGLKNLTDEFEIACAALGKSVSKKGGQAEAAGAYDKAATILESYLKGAELDPLGSDAYN